MANFSNRKIAAWGAAPMFPVTKIRERESLGKSAHSNFSFEPTCTWWLQAHRPKIWFIIPSIILSWWPTSMPVVKVRPSDWYIFPNPIPPENGMTTALVCDFCASVLEALAPKLAKMRGWFAKAFLFSGHELLKEADLEGKRLVAQCRPASQWIFQHGFL